MTLIELLVVIVILTILVAAAIPLLAPTSSDRQLREASRGLNTFLAGAQARAVGQSRPFGVALRRLSKQNGNDAPGDPNNSNGVAIQAFYVEQPPPFAGFDSTSAVQLAIDNGPTGGPGQVLVRFVRTASPDLSVADGLPPGWDPDPFPEGLVRPGDVVETGDTRLVFTDYGNGFIDLATGYYVAGAGNPPGTLVTKPIDFAGQIDAIYPIVDSMGFLIAGPPPASGFTAPYWTAPAPYKILRQPVPTSDEPFQLPADTVVDLRASGIGNDTFFFLPNVPPPFVDNPEDVVIMFAPEGRVSRVQYYAQDSGGALVSVAEPVVENIYLLVGPNVPAPPAVANDPTLTAVGWAAAVTVDDKQRLRGPVNWLLGESRWVVIGAASGRIVTVENELVDPAVVLATAATFAPPVPESKEQMRTLQVLAAREGTRGMSQLGGR